MTTFQEYECGAIDFDLDDTAIVMAGESFYCVLCGGHHTPEEVGLTQTAVPTAAGAEWFEWRGLPTSPEQRAAWIEEGRRNQAAREAVEHQADANDA